MGSNEALPSIDSLRSMVERLRQSAENVAGHSEAYRLAQRAIVVIESGLDDIEERRIASHRSRP